MADFCKQCSTVMFGYDYGELAGITPVEDWNEGRACVVICEGCGVIQVDPQGRCVSEDCMEKGHKHEPDPDSGNPGGTEGL